MKKSLTKLTLVLAWACLDSNCLYSDEGHAHGPDGSHISASFQSNDNGNYIRLSADSERNLGIEVVTVQRELLAPSRTLYGRVIADPRRVQQISAPFSGTVEKVYVLPGSFVKQGEELLRVQPIQVGSSSIALRAKQDGYVTELDVTPGVAFEPTTPLLVVSDLELVMFEGDLFDLNDANTINSGRSCSVHTKRFSGKHFDCRIETVDSRLNGDPPVGHVHASIPNIDGELKPGMTGEMLIASGEERNIITVPVVAILGQFEKRFVYRKEGSTFLKTFVKLGELYGDEQEVIEGLAAGDQVVIKGQYQLQYAKSDASAVAELQHDHDNDHDHNHANHSHVHETNPHPAQAKHQHDH